MKMSNETYDRLKIVSMIIGYSVTFILSLIDVWKIPHASQWSATVSALGVFLGSVLIASTKRYNSDAELHADDNDGGNG